MPARRRPVGSSQRSEQLHAIARGYVTEGLGKKNFDAIPYADDVSLRAPQCPGGLAVPLRGRENVRAKWWVPLFEGLKEVEVLDTYVNRSLSSVTVEFHCRLVDPPRTLRILDRFSVNADGEIVEHQNFFDPEDITNPEWRRIRT